MQPIRQPLPQHTDSHTFSCYAIHLKKQDPYWHYHKQIELIYAIEGSCRSLVGDSRDILSAGQLLLLGEDLPHDLVVEPEHPHCKFMVIHFHSEFLSAFPEFKATRELLDLAKLGLRFDDMPLAIKENLLDIENLEPPLQMVRMLTVLHELVQESQRHAPKVLSSVKFTKYDIEKQRYEKLNRVLAFIHDNKGESLSVDTVASHANMTSPAFCRWFKKSMSISFLTYLNNVRIEDACRLLINSQQQIGQIAIETGFDSLSSFNRNFLKLKGCSPSEYRKSVQTPA
ncbi:helix-turn-helix transcriptional regulator [Vibrio ishigakensis]|nr:AraC family transcriptional regulator [Vibrio ishigakensis]